MGDIQISGVEYATEFWRKTVRELAENEFEEDVNQDTYGGRVVRQQFISPYSNLKSIWKNKGFENLKDLESETA